ncbi:MAG TPA: hypothetical protein ENI62_09205 [Gammaproteobacteria bacterium]|nr:hypothetical protein [Gammaproteobacteria bacterium]
MLNLGSTFDCPRSQWSELTSRIEEIIQGQTALFEPSPDLEFLAQTLTASLLHKYAQTDFLDQPTATLYDLTNAFFEGTGKFNAMPPMVTPRNGAAACWASATLKSIHSPSAGIVGQ